MGPEKRTLSEGLGKSWNQCTVLTCALPGFRFHSLPFLPWEVSVKTKLPLLVEVFWFDLRFLLVIRSSLKKITYIPLEIKTFLSLLGSYFCVRTSVLVWGLFFCRNYIRPVRHVFSDEFTSGFFLLHNMVFCLSCLPGLKIWWTF